MHNTAGGVVIAQGETVYVPLPTSVPEKTKVKAGVLSPVQHSADEETNYWWWLLGIVAIALLI